MKNIKSVLLTLFVIFSISVLVAGCSKKDPQTVTEDTKNKDTKTQEMGSTNNHDMNKMNETKEVNTGNKQHVMINLPSMQCATCKKNIEAAVSKVDGVINVNVDKSEKVAHINFDKSKTDVSKIENAITAAGYDANDKKKDMKAYENLDDCCKLPKDQKEPGQH